MQIYSASKQWATRPEDERFNSLAEMYEATKRYASESKTATVRWTDLRVEHSQDENLRIVGKAGVPAVLTNYAFGQIAARVGAPASYLRQLPATLAAQNLNHGLKGKVDGADASLLFHKNGDLVLRAATTDEYSRIWNYEVIARLQDVSSRHGLIPGQQTFSWSGDKFVPSDTDRKALYASDHDMFAFLMSQDATILDPTGKTLRRGIITVNSEVGDKSLSVMGFYFRDVCCNHIIWGAEQIAEVRMTHRGDIRGRWLDAQVEIRKYLNTAASLDEAQLRKLTVRIGGTKEEVLDRLFGIKSIGLTYKALAASYDAVNPDEDGDPKSVYGFAQGVTRYSQQTPYADERTSLDRAAGRIMDFAF
jgi:hypothetical protein